MTAHLTGAFGGRVAPKVGAMLGLSLLVVTPACGNGQPGAVAFDPAGSSPAASTYTQGEVIRACDDILNGAKLHPSWPGVSFCVGHAATGSAATGVSIAVRPLAYERMTSDERDALTAEFAAVVEMPVNLKPGARPHAT
jgi:hypothetical protein